MGAALSSLQLVISRPAALFDPYAALDEVVNVTKDKKGVRATRFEIIRAKKCWVYGKAATLLARISARQNGIDCSDLF